jgi:glycosyltransferase involved in cell wall biosynthesis
MIEVIASPSTAAHEMLCRRGYPNVLLLVDEISRTLGGGERIILQLAAQLPRYGFAPLILTFSAHPGSAALQHPPCSIYRLPLQRTMNVKGLLAAFALGAFLKQHKIRLVHTFFGSADLWGGLVTKLMSDAKLVWALRDMGFLRTGKQRLAYRLLAGLPDAVFAVSERVRQQSIEVDRMLPTRVKTVYNGVNLSEWPKAPFPVKGSGEVRVTTVGNIRRIKGHDLFVRAAAIVVRRFPNAIFSIVGDVLEPDYFGELKTMVEGLNINSHFRFEGAIGDVRQSLVETDVFVLPSRSEGFSNAAIEAMAASLPIVATDVGGNGEAVADGINGLLVPADDPEALAAAISRLLSDPIKARAMGFSGRRIAEERFTAEVMMRQIAGAYRELLF